MAKYKDASGNIIEVGDPSLNPSLIAGKTLVPDTTNITTGAPIITSDLMKPQTPFNPVLPATVPVASVSGLNAEVAPLAPLPQETAQSDLIKQIQGLTMETTGEAGFRAQQEQAQGIPEITKTQSDLSARLKTLQNEALAIPLQLQQESIGRGITTGGLQPIQTAALRNNAIQALSVASLLEASRGNLTTAQSLADRATAQKYDPIKAEITAKLANLELLSKDPTLTLAQQNRLNAQTVAQEARKKQIEKQEADSKEINSVLNLATKYGLTDTSLMERIQNAKSPIEAKQLASQYLQDPKAQYELNATKLDNTLKQAQINKTQYELSLLKQYGGMSPIEYRKALKEEKAEIEKAKTEAEKTRLQADALDKKITLLGTVLDSSAIDSVVGPSAFSRAPTGISGFLGRFIAGATVGGAAGAVAGAPFAGVGAIPGAIGGALIGGFGTAGQGSVDYFTGDADALIGQTEQFISKEFLQNLIDVKAQGATFGALQKAEQDALTAAATFIGQRRLPKDRKENEQVVGYDMSEADFRKELGTIKDLTQKAYERATGKKFTDDEQQILDEFYQSVDVINPASYY